MTLVVYFTPGVFARMSSICFAASGCPFQRCAVGQLQVDICVALIFIRKEARRHTFGKESGRYAKGY